VNLRPILLQSIVDHCTIHRIISKIGAKGLLFPPEDY
jgi:hypothetical protein